MMTWFCTLSSEKYVTVLYLIVYGLVPIAIVICRARKYVMANSINNYWMCDVINDVMGLSSNNDYVNDFMTLLQKENNVKEYKDRDYSLVLQCLSEERIVCFVCFFLYHNNI